LKSKNISFEIIENSGPDNLRDTLKIKLAQTIEVSIEVAFLTQAGLNEIIQPLRQVAALGKVKLITGLYQHVTEPQALETLLNIQNETRGNFSVSLSTEPQFHRKVYLLESKTQATAIIGSSNLTREGLQSGGELNIILTLPKNTPSIRKLKNIFEQEWKHRAVLLEASQIERYKQARKTSDKSKSFNQSKIEIILGVKPNHKNATPVITEPVNFWLDCITSSVSKSTAEKISEKTNWDEKHYEWFSTGKKYSYHIKDRIILFDKLDNSLSFIEIKDIAEIKVPVSKDGRNFIAYKYISGYQRKLTKNLWKLLEVESVTEKNCSHKKLSMEKATRLASLIKPKRG